MNNRFLLISNAYPSSENIYRNGFIHRRVKSYLDKDYKVDVFYLHSSFLNADIYTYDGVTVNTGNREHYENFLKINEYDNYLIHFVNPDMYFPIVNNIDNPNITIWIHGF